MATTTTTKKSGTPDPKPLTKRQQAAEAKRLQVLADEQAKLDSSPSKLPLSDALIAEAFNEGATIAELAREVGKSHDTIRQVLGAHGVNFDHDKNALDLKDKVRQASAATIARREANAADKAKLAETKAADRAKRAEGSKALVDGVLAKYAETKSVNDTAAATINATTGQPYSATRIRRILESAGVLQRTPRGDTSERDQTIVTAYRALVSKGEGTLDDLAKENNLSTARVRGILRKGGIEIAGGTRSGKLPEPGTPEYREFVEDVAKLTEKWGVALGTMAHAIRRAPDALAAS